METKKNESTTSNESFMRIISCPMEYPGIYPFSLIDNNLHKSFGISTIHPGPRERGLIRVSVQRRGREHNEHVPNFLDLQRNAAQDRLTLGVPGNQDQ